MTTGYKSQVATGPDINTRAATTEKGTPPFLHLELAPPKSSAMLYPGSVSFPVQPLFKKKVMIKNLTKREKEIAELVAKGKSNEGIAIELNKKASSIRTCLKTIYSKLFIDTDERINKRVILSIMVKEESEGKE